MVDDVATGLGNIKLTSNEEEVIRVPPSLDLGLRLTFFPLFFSVF